MSSGERERPLIKVEQNELDALIDEDGCQTSEILRKELDAAQAAIARCFKAMTKISTTLRWVLHELTERKKKNEDPLAILCSQGLKRTRVLH